MAVPPAGLAWSRVPHDEAALGGIGYQTMSSVVAAGPGLVAVGRNLYGTGYGDAAVWTSPDGLAWSPVPSVDGGSAGMSSVAVGGPGLVAVGWDESVVPWDAAAWTSVDGLAWSRVPDVEAAFGGAGNQTMSSVVAGGPGLVAVGLDESGGDADAAVWTSADGFSWSRLPHDEAAFGGTGNQAMSSVAVGGPGLVAVGYSEPGDDAAAAVWTSTDGLAWSRVPHDEAALGGPNDQAMRSVVAGGPGLVAVGWDASGGDWQAAVWTSSDGLVWSRVRHLGAVFGGASVIWSRAVGGPGMVAVGADGSGGDSDAAVWTSADGLAWSRVPHDEAAFGGAGNQVMSSVAVGGPGLVAVGYEESDAATHAAVWVSGPPG
jgi:hypothetical protein